MSTATSSLIVPDNSIWQINPWCCRKFQTIISNRARLSAISKPKDKFEFLRNQPLQSFNVKDVVVYSSAQPEPPLSSDTSPHSWNLWIVGMLISVILPFWKNKWGPFQSLKNQVEATMQTVEHVAEIVEDFAEEEDKVAEEVANHLPQGGKLKDAVTFIDNVAKETAKDARLADEFIEKVEEMEKQVVSFIHTATDQTSEAAKE